MNTLALIAIVAISGHPCASNFCRQKVAVVHHAQAYHAAVYAVPYNAQQSRFYDDADVLTQAIKQGVGEALDERSIGQRPLALSGGIDLQKCTRCHGANATGPKAELAQSHYVFPADASLQNAAVAAKVLRGLRSGMAGSQYANLSAQQTEVWFNAVTDAVEGHLEALGE